MRRFGLWLGRVLLALILGVAIAWLLAPREPVDTEISFDPNSLGGDLDAYLAQEEARFSDIVPGAQKQVIWAGARGARTPLSVIYIHGFSASAPEIAPVPQQVAAALGANLYFTRLRGHGRDGAAMGEAEAGDWLEDMAEALAIGARLGERTLILSTSTGSTLAAIAATDSAAMARVAGIVFVSPNFRVNSAAAFLLRAPFARRWLPLLLGEERAFTPMNERHARYWSERYPLVALLPMAALVQHARSLDYGAVSTPALFYFSDADKVVDARETRRIAARWGGKVTIVSPDLTPADDPHAHVIAGDIVSPGQTGAAVQAILAWARGL